jgi:menaquinol-cytochrome c reductase iron-sulfur subunit
MKAQFTRRNFLNRLMFGFWGVMAAALGLPAAAYLGIPRRPETGAGWVEAGDAAQLTPVPQQLVFERRRTDGWKVVTEKAAAWVAKSQDGGVVAFAPQCTHLGCAYHWENAKNKFVCPCHASAFAPDGTVLAGPAPRPLDRYEVKVENGKLFVGAVRRSEPETV